MLFCDPRRKRKYVSSVYIIPECPTNSVLCDQVMIARSPEALLFCCYALIHDVHDGSRLQPEVKRRGMKYAVRPHITKELRLWVS